MTDMSLTIPRGMKWTVVAGTPPTEICGKLLGNVDNDRLSRPRWAELELFRYIDTNPGHDTYGHELYLLHTMGHSLVYHRLDCDSNRGIEAPAGKFPEIAEFPDDLEPCADEYVKGRQVPGCYPPDWRKVPPATKLRVEVIRHVTIKCRNADAVIERLSRPSKTTCDICNGSRKIASVVGQEMVTAQCWKCDGQGWMPGPPALTAPGGRLIETVKYEDDAIREAAGRKVRL